MNLTESERRFSSAVHHKIAELRAFLASSSGSSEAEPCEAYIFLSGLKAVLGNLNNDLSYIATLMAKEYLLRHFDIGTFDAGAKAQGASGIDIEFHTLDGKHIAAEIKTTFPYQPNFGAKQREEISKDIDRLKNSTADVKILFLTEQLSFEAAKNIRTWIGAGIRVVLLPSSEEHLL